MIPEILGAIEASDNREVQGMGFFDAAFAIGKARTGVEGLHTLEGRKATRTALVTAQLFNQCAATGSRGRGTREFF